MGVLGDTDVQNVSVTITNEKLTKVVWDMEMSGQTVTVECLLSYDNLTFQFPEINA